MSRPIPPEGISAGVEGVIDGRPPRESDAHRIESDRWLVRTLVSRGVLDTAAVQEAEEIQRRTAEPIGRIIVALGYASDRDVAAVLAARVELPYVPHPNPSPDAAGL